MSFGAWFKEWILAFCKLLTFDHRKPRSDFQRKRERERRLRAKHSSANFYRAKKPYKRRRSGMDVRNEKMIKALFGFIGATLGILLVPFGLLDWAHKSIKIKKATKSSSLTKGKQAAAVSKKPNGATAGTPSRPSAPKQAQPTRASHKPAEDIKPIQAIDTSFAPSFSQVGRAEPIAPPAATEPRALDESTPRSQPMNEKDQYVRKRMTVAGSFYYDAAVVSQLTVGAYIRLVPEPDNPYDKNAVALHYQGAKIGYVARRDLLPLANALKLGRSMYGVITDLQSRDGRQEIEYEVWFSAQE